MGVAVVTIEFEPVEECLFCYAENATSRQVCWYCGGMLPTRVRWVVEALNADGGKDESG